jgi:hypothetical protein
MIRRIYHYFSKPKNLSILNGILILLIVGFNIYFQAFCIPVTWAMLVLIVCFLNTVMYPYLEITRYAKLIAFINGVSLCVFIYCVLFLEHVNVIGAFTIILFGLGLVTYVFILKFARKYFFKSVTKSNMRYILSRCILFAVVAIIFGLSYRFTGIFALILFGSGLVTIIPLFFVLQLATKYFFKPITKSVFRYFLSGCILCVVVATCFGLAYRFAINSIEKFKESDYAILEKNFMTEKILGMHFIYHTRICEYDGWRPPKHDPALVIGMWLNGRKDPLNVDLETRLGLYRKFFPGNRYKFDCSCGIEYSSNYHNDELWITNKDEIW